MNIVESVSKNRSLISNILGGTFPSAKNSMTLGDFELPSPQITGDISPEKFKKSMEAIKLQKLEG
jgi:hypothetical protein